MPSQLPSLSVPSYETKLPSTGKPIKYRPFLVREEKLLLLAMESEDEKEIKDAVTKLHKSCITSRGFKIESLAQFDLEYLFLKIRSVSAGSAVEMKVTCLDDNQTQVNVTIDLDEVEVDFPEGHDNKIMLNEDVGMVMKYPGFDHFVNITLLNNELSTTDEIFGVIASCVDQIFQGDDVWDSSDMKESEIIEFLEGMTNKQFESVQNFFTTIPVLRHKFVVTNPNTGVDSTYTLEGLQSFFG